MDHLSLEMLGHTFSFLPFRDLINCRLVCKSFKCEVDHELATLTHIRINEDGLNQTFIPQLLHPSLVSLQVDCEEEQFTLLFTFLQVRCPNLRVLSAIDDRIPLEQLLKISKNLVYFEVNDIIDVGRRRPSELRLLFPCLKALQINNLQKSNAFCLDEWTAHGEESSFKTAKLIQSRDVCCRSCESSPGSSIPQGISWYICRKPLSDTAARQLNDPSVANSLRMLELNIGEIAFNFNLPNLARAKFCFSLCNKSGSILNCLKNSSNLKVLFLFFYDMEVLSESICSLVSSLKQLRSLSLTHEPSQAKEPLQLSLPPKLIHLYINGFRLQPQTHSNSVKFANFFDSASKFSFPNLLECHIQFVGSDYSPEIEDTFNSLEHSTNLQKLEIKFEIPECYDPETSPTLSIYSILPRLRKLESIDIEIFDEIPSVSFTPSDLPNLRFLRWENYDDEENKWNIHFDRKYESVCYESDHRLTLRPANGHSVKVRLAKGAKVHFKYPIESTVTKATFLLPSKVPLFNMPQLIECKVIIESGGSPVDTLCSSLSTCYNLQVFTLVTKGRMKITLAQLDTLIFTLDQLKFLQRLEGTVNLCSRSSPSDARKGPAQFPSLSRVQHNWQLKLVC